MGHFEVVFEWAPSESVMLNVCHYEITGNQPYDLQDLTDEFASIVSTLAVSNLPPNVDFTAVTYREDVPGAVGVRFTPTGGPVSGTSAGADYAPCYAMLMRKETGSLVRPNKGWLFYGGITASYLGSNGRFSSVGVAACQAFWNDMLQVSFAGNGLAQMVIKATNPTAPNTQPYTDVTSMTGVSIVKTMHSRVANVGV